MANLLFATRESDSLRSENPKMSQPSRGLVLGLEPEQPNRCEEEWGEPASQGFEPGSGVIWSPECLGYWGDRYLWHPNTLRGDGAIPGRTGAAPVHGERWSRPRSGLPCG